MFRSLKSGSWAVAAWRKFDVSGRYFVVPNALMENAALSSSETLVLIGLLRYANKQGECFPGIESLVKITKLSRRTVQRCIRSLEEKGEIKVRQRLATGKTGKQYNRSNDYYIPGRVMMTPPLRNDDTTGAKECHPGSVMDTPEHYQGTGTNNSTPQQWGGEDFSIDDLMNNSRSPGEGSDDEQGISRIS